MAQNKQCGNKNKPKNTAVLSAALLTALALLLLAILPGTAALPPIAAEFYGQVMIEGNPAPPGTNITIQDSDENTCGSQATTSPGEFGLLSCNGDDPATSKDEGPASGETIFVKVNGINAYNSTWQAGGLYKIRLEPSTKGSKELGSTRIPMVMIIGAVSVMFGIVSFVYTRKGV